MHEIDLTHGAVLETGCVYIVPLLEHADFSSRVSGTANPKSSTGRIDVFTRLITDRATGLRPGRSGLSRAALCGDFAAHLSDPGAQRLEAQSAAHPPRLAAVHRYAVAQAARGESRCVDGEADIDNGLALSIDLLGESGSRIGWRAKRHTGIIDVDKRDALSPRDFWESVEAHSEGHMILDPDEFYILVSREAVAIPYDHAAEMVPFNPLVGEFRVHYAGFFDPGFGYEPGKPPCARGVLEVRSREVPFILEHGQIIGRLVFERLTDPPPEVYGQGIGSNYQRQGLKLSKHFRGG